MYNRTEQRQNPFTTVLAICGYIAAFVLFLTLTVYALGTSWVSVNPGEEAVLVDKPRFWGDEGVRKKPLKEGRMLVWDSTEARLIKMTPHAIKIPFDDLSSKDNILLDFESTITLRVTDSVRMVDFGNDWFDHNLASPYRAIVRDVVKKETMSDVMSDSKTAATMDAAITSELKKLVIDRGLPVEVIDISLGRARPNKEVLEQMNLTAQEQQRRKTLTESDEAEKQRANVERSRATADNAYRNAMQLSPEQYVRLQEVRLYSDACKQSATCIVTSGQGNVTVSAKN